MPPGTSAVAVSTLRPWMIEALFSSLEFCAYALFSSLEFCADALFSNFEFCANGFVDLFGVGVGACAEG